MDGTLTRIQSDVDVFFPTCPPVEATVRMMKNMMKHHKDGRKTDVSRPDLSR